MGAFPGTPAVADWVASLVTDGTLTAALGEEGRARFALAERPVEEPKVTFDEAALDRESRAAMRRWATKKRSRPSDDGRSRIRPHPRNGRRQSSGWTAVSLMFRGESQRKRFSTEPALSFVPERRAPPNGCRPTIAPVGLSLM